MKTTVQVSLSGIAFNLDENAYQQLKSYIDELELHFKDDKEIIDDIETRIADLLSLRIKSIDQAVKLSDINEIIETIGNPKQIDDGENTSPENFKKQFESVNQPIRKRLYRDTENRVIAGVCSGLGHYLKVDAAWIRVVFIVFMILSVQTAGWSFGSRSITFGMPFVLFAYIIMWIVMPKTKTTRQTLEMHGYESNQQSNNNNENGFLDFVGGFLRVLVKICVIVTLSIVILVCSSLLIAAVVGFFGGSLFGGTNLISLIDYINMGIGNEFIQKLALALLIFIPLFLFVYYSIKTLLRLKYSDKPMSILCGIVWFLSVLYVGGNVAVMFSDKYTYSREKFDLVDKGNKVLNVELPSNYEQMEFTGVHFDNTLIYRKDDDKNSIYIRPQVYVRRVDSVVDCRIEVSKSACARSRKQEKDIVNQMPKGYVQSDSTTITLEPMRFDKHNKWSFENIGIFIYVTDSTEVKFENTEIWD